MLQFSIEADIPRLVGLPTVRYALPASTRRTGRLPEATEPTKRIWYVKERRTDAEAAEILAEALDLLRTRRKSGEVIF